jgi:peptidoglycan/xylan/chitin deacetylase (PgdA/CDA1 family)
MRLAAVSVDLDEIPHYFAIHGLAEPAGAVRNLVYDVALDRLIEIASELAIPLTLFAVAADLRRQAAAAKLRDAARRGWEIANHSLDHRYDLVRLDRAEMRRQVEEGARQIHEATGVSPRGFRAPGYTVSDALFGVLQELGVKYDSSVFPCPGYWAAKAVKVSAIALRGRASRSIIDSPLVLRAPTRPYRVGQPYWSKGYGLLELPIQVTRGFRLPFIGTALTLGGPKLARRMARACVGEPLVNLELHGIDALDGSDGLDSLAAHQTDVRVPKANKSNALRAAISELREAGYSFVTLGAAADALGPVS